MISGLQFLAAMRQPTFNSNDISNRLKRLFFAINVPTPSLNAIGGIYVRILKEIMPPKKYPQDTIDMIEPIVEATFQLYKLTLNRFLPTPKNFHYSFSFHEL